MQAHAKQRELDHSKLAAAAEQDRAAAESQMARLDSNLTEARQEVAALKQALVDKDPAQAQTMQVI